MTLFHWIILLSGVAVTLVIWNSNYSRYTHSGEISKSIVGNILEDHNIKVPSPLIKSLIFEKAPDIVEIKLEGFLNFEILANKSEGLLVLSWTKKGTQEVNVQFINKEMVNKISDITKVQEEKKDSKGNTEYIDKYVFHSKIEIPGETEPHYIEIKTGKEITADYARTKFKEIVDSAKLPDGIENKMRINKYIVWDKKRKEVNKKSLAWGASTSVAVFLIGYGMSGGEPDPIDPVLQAKQEKEKITTTVCQTTNMMVRRNYGGVSNGNCQVTGDMETGNLTVRYGLREGSRTINYTAKVYYNSDRNTVRLNDVDFHGNIAYFVTGRTR
ncbi:MAG: hypothetical protein U5L98_06905 [Halomonas sp.]|uniref:hypothetical protein n=1 Tax=Halomonas sp. TaxID=1486246 RepID=UPI002ACECDF2|nr:hypothetical protein [Halomonas sp.]MDZ7852371.1 hypothetical protein [Halomonas sp.]